MTRWQDDVSLDEWDEWQSIARRAAYGRNRSAVNSAQDLASLVIEKLLKEDSRPPNIEAWIKKVTKTTFIDLWRTRTKFSKVDIDDLCHTSHDPLLAKLRYNLRREHGAARDGKKIGIACVFSREAVAPPDASCAVQGDGSLNCSGYGSVVSVTATFGQCAAGWVFDQISSRSLLKA